MTILAVMDVVFPARRMIFDATCSGEKGKTLTLEYIEI